jgi:tetratricopeptide (TPR) repeat protein
VFRIAISTSLAAGRQNVFLRTEFDRALTDLTFVRDALHQTGETALEHDLLIALGQLYRKTDHGVEATQYLEQALQASRLTGNLHAVADTLYHLGTVFWDEGDNVRTLARQGEAVNISRSLGLHDIVAVQAIHGLGEAIFMQGRAQTATQYFTESLELARQVGDFSYEAENLQAGRIHLLVAACKG